MKNLKKHIIISVLVISCALTACSKPSNPAAVSTDEKTEGEVFNSSQSDFSDMEQTTSEETTPVNLPPETIEEEQTYKFNHYEEIPINQQLLKTLKGDKLYIRVYLYLDEEVVRSEYKEAYPNISDDYMHWWNFFCERGDKIIREVASDYGIDYEELSYPLNFFACFFYEFDKDTISSLLIDPRVETVVYCVGEYAHGHDF